MAQKLLTFFLILAIGVVGFIGACNPPLSTPTEFEELKPTENLENATSNVTEAKKKIKEGTSKIDTSADVIKRNAKEINSAVPEEVKLTVAPHTSRIISESDAIKSEAALIAALEKQLGQALSDLNIATDKMRQMEEQLVASIGERDKAFEERDKIMEKLEEAEARESEATARLLRWLILACVIAAGASVALMVFHNFGTGATLLAGSIATLILAITVNAYFEWIAIGGLVVLAIVVVAIGFQLWRKQKSIEEVVTTTEITKSRLTPEQRKELFGNKAEPGIISTVQSTSTEGIVDKVRRKMAKKWDHTLKD